MKKTNPLLSLLPIGCFVLTSLGCTKTDYLGLAGNYDSGVDGSEARGGVTGTGGTAPGLGGMNSATDLDGGTGGAGSGGAGGNATGGAGGVATGGTTSSGGTAGGGGGASGGTGGAGGSDGGPADTYLACYEIADPSDFVEVIKTTAQGMCVRLMLESAYSPGFTLGLTITPKGWGVWDTARWPSSAAPCTTTGTPKVATQASSGKGTVTINGYPYRAGFTVDVDLVLTYPIGDSGASETETLQANAIPSDFTCYALSRGTGGSSGTATGGAGGSGGSTGSSGGIDGGSTDGTGGTNCDPRDVMCDQVPPTCGQGQVPRVVASCYDSTCVPIDQCQCTVAEECPDYPGQYTCYMDSQRCNYWMP